MEVQAWLSVPQRNDDLYWNEATRPQRQRNLLRERAERYDKHLRISPLFLSSVQLHTTIHKQHAVPLLPRLSDPRARIEPRAPTDQAAHFLSSQ